MSREDLNYNYSVNLGELLEAAELRETENMRVVRPEPGIDRFVDLRLDNDANNDPSPSSSSISSSRATEATAVHIGMSSLGLSSAPGSVVDNDNANNGNNQVPPPNANVPGNSGNQNNAPNNNKKDDDEKKKKDDDDRKRRELFPVGAYICKRIIEKDDKHEAQFGGVTYRNRFMVDKPIKFVFAGFYGPKKDEPGKNFFVYLQLERESDFKLLEKKEVKVECKKDVEIFYVGFERIIDIQPFTWYALGFDLGINSPHTYTGNKVYTQVTEEGVTFHFSRGSSQMPEIIFMK